MSLGPSEGASRRSASAAGRASASRYAWIRKGARARYAGTKHEGTVDHRFANGSIRMDWGASVGDALLPIVSKTLLERADQPPTPWTPSEVDAAERLVRAGAVDHAVMDRARNIEVAQMDASLAAEERDA